MFCRNCGKELVGSPESCTACGGKPTSGTGFCPGCGGPTDELTKLCPQCGVRVTGKPGAWMPLTAGIFNLIIGIPMLLGGIVLILGGKILLEMLRELIADYPELLMKLSSINVNVLFAGAGVVIIVLAAAAIVGGIFALRKRRWKLALVGSICGIFVGLPLYLSGLWLGMPAALFIVLGRKHFK